MTRKTQRQQITNVLPHEPLGNPSPPSQNKRFWETRPFKWGLGIAGIVFTTIFGLEVANAWNNRCTTFPIAYELVREQTCPPALRATTEEFLVVLGRLAYEDSAGNRAENLLATDRVSRALVQGLSEPEFPPELNIRLLPHTDPWVDRISVRTDLQEYGKLMATRFDARLIVYGIVVDSGQSVEYRPCIYVSSVSDNVDLSIMGDDTTICETGSVPFLENDGSDTLRNWITGVRQLTIGLERHQEGRTSEGNTLQSFEAALSSFELVTANPIPGLAALGHIYAGNAAVDIALRLQMNDPNCIAGRCRSYDPQIEQFYIRAWDHYSGVLELQTESDQAFYRALIGRGNVHYRLAQLTRLTSDTDEIVDYPQDYSIEYNCSNASLMLITNETGVGETLDWYQRSFAAMACYQQAARIAPDDADQQIKISFGLAQTRQWLGQEADNAELLDASIESYENAIEQLEQLYPQQEDRPSELRCLAGVAYGERGRVRWQSALLHQTLLSSQVRADLVEAVQILGDETNMCYLDTELSGYRLDLQSIP